MSICKNSHRLCKAAGNIIYSDCYNACDGDREARIPEHLFSLVRLVNNKAQNSEVGRVGN